MMSRPEVSIVIPNWNGMPLIVRCLEKIKDCTREIPSEIIVVDNVSQDDSCRTIKEKFPHVTLIRNKKNYYFAMPTNLGIKKSSGDFLFLLNNDALLEVNTLKILMDKLKDDPKIGAVSPQLLYPNGAIQPSCRRFPTFNNLMASGLRLDIFFKKNSWKMTDWDHLTPQFVEQPMMSALLIRRSCWQDVGELDERFPLYFNDVDWCYRAALKGSKISYKKMPQKWTQILFPL